MSGILRRLFAAAFGEDSLFDNARYNRELYRSGRANRSIVQHTTIGWRPDPINGEDGFTSNPGNDRIVSDTNGTGTYDTPSGNVEYHRVVKKGG